MKRRKGGYAIPVLGSCTVVAVGLAFCHTDKLTPDSIMGYANGKDCYLGECSQRPTITDCVYCCATRCTQWSVDCAKLCVGSKPKGDVLIELVQSAKLVQSKDTSDQAAFDKAVVFVKVMKTYPDNDLRAIACGVASETPFVGDVQ